MLIGNKGNDGICANFSKSESTYFVIIKKENVELVLDEFQELLLVIFTHFQKIKT